MGRTDSDGIINVSVKLTDLRCEHAPKLARCAGFVYLDSFVISVI